jgi:hypothetical protein
MPTFATDELRPVAALQGASSAVIQTLLADFAARMTASGLAVAGVVEIATQCDDGGCGRLAVRDLSTSELIPISQDLGPGSTACNLDPRGLASACAAVERAIADGADIVVLSKFGKQEAARGGLIDAFRAAFAAGLPIATAVSPAMTQEWRAFAGEYGDFVDARTDSLEAWWSRRRRGIMRAAAE